MAEARRAMAAVAARDSVEAVARESAEAEAAVRGMEEAGAEAADSREASEALGTGAAREMEAVAMDTAVVAAVEMVAAMVEEEPEAALAGVATEAARVEGTEGVTEAVVTAAVPADVAAAREAMVTEAASAVEKEGAMGAAV